MFSTAKKERLLYNFLTAKQIYSALCATVMLAHKLAIWVIAARAIINYVSLRDRKN